MQPRPLQDGVFQVGAIDWDRRVFDELIPLADGTSYNAYLVRGSTGTALVDTVEPAFCETLLANLEGLGVQKLDYVVANHAEQDHSGSLPTILRRFPEAKLLCTSKCQSLLIDHLGISPDRITPVEDGATVSLGDKTLRFVHFPWVHWPETMLTFVVEPRLLFSCDLFGAHLATSKGLTERDPKVLETAKLYYGTIMMPFRSVIAKSFAKVKALDPTMIAPSHGPAWSRPADILEAYDEWLYATPKNLVVLPYVSMHDSTRQMVRHLSESLMNRQVQVEVINVGREDLAKLALALVDAATIVMGTPMVLSGAHPKMIYVAHLASVLKPKARFASVIGSFGWGGKLAEQLTGIVQGLKLDIIPPVLVKGAPKPEHFASLDALADAILAKHRTLTAQ